MFRKLLISQASDSYPVDLAGALTTKGLWLCAFGGMKSLKEERGLLAVLGFLAVKADTVGLRPGSEGRKEMEDRSELII